MDKFSKNRVSRFLKQMKPTSTVAANFGRFFMTSMSNKKTEGENKPSLAKKRAQHYKDFAATGVLGASLMAAGVQQDEATTISTLFECIGNMLDTTMTEKVRQNTCIIPVLEILP